MFMPSPGFAAHTCSDAVGRFRHAMQANDPDALDGLFRQDVCFRSPRTAKPLHGVRATKLMLWAAMSNLARLTYVGHVGPSTGGVDPRAAETHVLLFDAVGVRGAQLNGVDILELDQDGFICAVTIMLRPLESVAAVRRLDDRRLGGGRDVDYREASGSSQRSDSPA